MMIPLLPITKQAKLGTSVFRHSTMTQNKEEILHHRQINHWDCFGRKYGLPPQRTAAQAFAFGYGNSELSLTSDMQPFSFHKPSCLFHHCGYQHMTEHIYMQTSILCASSTSMISLNSSFPCESHIF